MNPDKWRFTVSEELAASIFRVVQTGLDWALHLILTGYVN